MIHQFIKNYWKSLLWAVFIMILCGIPGNELNKVKLINIPHFDKMVHAFLYFVFTILLISENNSQKMEMIIPMKAILIAALIALSYGALIEIMQKTIFINRGAEVCDMVANTFGFLLAAALYRQANKITKGYL